ncbi:MAG: tRNA (adenosine(37)-N6)-threonylcarbamoyltransferase complex ATPase subunit type 1 TsaE [Lentisphaeria bacterium]|nr:tRNA (adenosine(37)-N6)-threonylcarbamoyltransferase complex ATPase subunit type 1 TsaE [Lentisphaeria bacterium]
MKKIIERITSRSEKDTEKFAFDLAQRLPLGSMLTLQGDLGAGKTVFARGFARGLGITEPVSSPTYTIVQEYSLPGQGRLYHLDLYRISSAESALAFGVDEFFDDSNAFKLVEWAERAENLIPENAIRVSIRHLGENEREIIAEN